MSRPSGAWQGLLQPNTCFWGVRETETCSERTISPPLTWPSTLETWLGFLLLIFSAVGAQPPLEEGSAQSNFLGVAGKGQKGERMNPVLDFLDSSLALPLPGCVTLGKLLNLSVPQFPPL